MRKLKKPLSILLSAMLIISLFTIIPFNVSAAETEVVSYVDENGSDQTVTATILTGDEELTQSGDLVLGVDSNTTTTWYAVLDDVTYGDGNSTVNIEILGKVCIIVADGSTLTVNGSIKKSPDASISLSDVYLYGQSDQTGAVSVDNIDLMDNIVVCGGSLTVVDIDQNITSLSDGVIIDTYQGSLTADTINAQRIRLYGGKLNADIISTCFTYNDGGVLNTRILESKNPEEQPEYSDISVQIQRGITNISGSLKTNGMELGCGDMDSRITIYDFTIDASTNTKKVVVGQTLTDGDREYSGGLSAYDLSAMARKTLMMAHEHSADTMTYHPAAEPSYDPSDGSYTNGNAAYYTCPTCGLNYVDENGSFVRKTTEEVTIPYFSFRTVVVDGNTLCEVVGYNGQDADIVIPDTVPDNYPDEDQRNNTVTGIDHEAFKGKTTLVSVTAGNSLRGIYESAFIGCTSLKTVTVGSSLSHIGADAFKGCTALTSFTSTSTESIEYFYNDEHHENSFDTNSNITFSGPHGSTLLAIANDYSCSFTATDDHTVAWAWSADYSSATATFSCTGCQLSGKEYEADVTKDGVYATATVTVEGKTYTESINFAVAMIEPDRYYASVADALPYACANDAVIILLKDATLQYTNELCELYPTFRLKENGHTFVCNRPPCYNGLSITAPDENGVSIYAVEAEHDVDFDNIYCILEEDAGNYTTAVHMICPRCGFDTVLRNEVEKHAAAAPTCTESGNVEYYSIYEYNGGYPFTNYYVLKDPAEAAYENELELLGTDVADVTIPATGHNMTAHPAVAPMLIVEGNSAYWSCDRCGKYFSDENGEHEIPENSWILPGTATLVPTSYIDENGEEQTVGAIVLTGDEAEDYHTTSSGFYFYTALGDASDLPIWYVVNQDTSLYHDENFKRNIELTGDVRIIVADGATFTVQGEIKGGSLSVYGQTNDTGKVVADKITNYGNVKVCSGGLTVANTVSCNALAIYSGTTNIAGNTYAGDSLLLGCNDDNDSITFGSLSKHYDATAAVVEGQTITDGANDYSGSLADIDLSNMAGKTLTRAHSHEIQELTYHAEVLPTYDPVTNTYTTGSRAHYHCEKCGAYFVLDKSASPTLRLERISADDIPMLYFRFRSVTVAGYTLCEIIEYNGADANVVIPDTVPADYPDEAQRGNTVTGIDSNAFKNNTAIESITTGDGCRGIYESAFTGCTSLKTVTVGSSLSHIGTDAFKGCAALERFTSTSTEDITYSHIEIPEDPENPEQPAINEYSFDTNTTVDFYGPHGSTLYAIAKDFNCDFIPTDRHPDPTWEWARDYSGATAHFRCNGCSYSADLPADSVVSQDGGLAIYDVSVTTADGYTYTDRRTSATMWVDYIDKDGNDASAEANIVTGNEAFFGEPGKTTWYVVNGDINFGDLDMVLAGDTNIILANGAKLEGIRDIKSVSEEEPESEDDKPKLYIFGQNKQNGKMEAGNIDSDVSMISYGGSLKANMIEANYILWRGSAKTENVRSAVLEVMSGAMKVDNSLIAGSVGVAGGSLKAISIDILDIEGSLSMLNGSLYVNYVYVCGDTYFTGGTTVVTDKAKVANITIGCNSQNDSITVGQYEFLNDDNTMTVVPDETLFDGLNTYTGTVTRDEAAAMAGKRVMLAHEHTDADMTRHAAVTPTYDPATGEYTDGNIEYYTCNKCNGCFVKDNGEYTVVAPESVVVPYFRYTLDSDETSCILSEYNGQDADIVIPDTVPDNYPDEALRGETVTSIDRIAFWKNTTITSVTAGDELKIIGSKAFKDCTELKSVTVGNGLEWIQSGAFEDCTELESFTSSAHSFTYVYGEQHRPNSFDENAEIVFHGPHGGTLLEISQLETKWSFIPTDRHQDPTWTWAADYSSATAAFNCNNTCQLENGYELTDSDIESAETDIGTQYTASVELDGETYTDVKLISYWKQLQAQINASPDNPSVPTFITVTHDITADTDDFALTVPSGKHITLMLQGHTIDRNLESAVANGNVSTNNGALSLVGADGTITGGKNTANGGAIVNNGTLNITGTTITGNVTYKDGGAVYNSGTVNFESGTMSCNSAGKNGSGSGGALSAHSGTININSNNCYIKNNTAEGHGGAIYLGANSTNNTTATLNLNGGRITENSAGNQGGAILHNGILNVQGRPYVKGNTAANGNNIYLRPNKLINVTGHLDSNDEYLGVKVENNVTGVFTTNLANQGSPAKFFTDSDDYFIANNNGEAALARYYVLSFDNNGGSGAQSSIKSKTSSIELPDCTFDAPEGMVFKAWKDPDGGTHKQPGETTEITSGYSKSMLAIWENLYNITVAESDHGTVTPSKYQAVQGETITLTIQPEDGYALESIHYITDIGGLDPQSTTGFIMPDTDVNIIAVFKSAIPYVDAEGNDMPPVIAQPINSGSTEWSEEWYYVAGEVTINDRVTVKGDVNLILCDGAVLNIPKGVTLNNYNGSCLTIWQQKKGTGALNVTAPESGNAGIGGIKSDDNYKSGGGLLYINGGIITACGGATGGAGIGVGQSLKFPLNMIIVINGGSVTATGNASFAAGIGVYSGEIDIFGGTVNATGGDYAPGIGASGNVGGNKVEKIFIYIEGGKVTATGGSCAAGIGGEANYSGGTITISGGEVTAKGGDRMQYGDQNQYAGAGIGSGAIINDHYNVNTKIYISGGKVNATGGCSYGSAIAAAAGIGVGEERPDMQNGQGDAEITLSWTDDVMNTMAVTSNGYSGAVMLDSPFVDDNGAIYNIGAVDDNSTIAGKTLRPYDGMGVTLAGHTLSLDGDIAVNFYMLLDDSVATSEGAYMQFTVPDTSPEYQSQKVMVSAADKVGDYYVFKCRVAAKDMDAQITAQIIDGEVAGKTYTYSVREYAEYLLAHLNVPEYAEAEQLVRAMLAYGKNAAYYFAGGDKEPETIDTVIPESAPTIAQSAEGIYDGASLSLKSQTTLSIYFKSGSPLELSIDDKTVDYEVVNDGINYAIRIRNIAVYDLDKPITVKVNGEDAVTYSPLNYCCKAQSSSDPKLVNTMKALYNYWVAADAYF